MSFEIYAPDFSNRHEITHAASIRTSIYYNDVGKISMILPIDDYNINAAKVGSLILDKMRWQTFWVASVKIETSSNQIIVNGYTSNYLLNKRVVGVATQITNIESGVYQTISNNLRGLSTIEISTPAGLSESVEETTLFGGQLLDSIIPILSVGDLGHRMVWDHKRRKHTFEIYKGRDLTTGIHSAVFSYERGTAEELVISNDISLEKNVLYITGKTTDDRTIVEIVGDASGENRSEKWLYEGIAQEVEETEEQLRQRMISTANSLAVDYMKRQNFSVSIDPNDLGIKYDLGDLVTCFSTKFGVKFNKRITGVTYSLDSTGSKTSIVLGDPSLTILKEMKLNG